MFIKNCTPLLVVALLLSLSACKCNKPVVTEGDTPVYIYTFEQMAPVTTDNTKKLIGDYLGISAVPNLTVSADENVAYFVDDKDVNTTFEQDLNNGNFAFSKINQSYLGDLVPQLPTKEEAEKISQKYLQDKGLYAKNPAELQLLHSGGVRAQTIKDQKPGPVVDKMITLTYGRTLDSMQVIGPGSKIVVNIGDKGEVLGLIHRWRELNTSGKQLVKPEEMISMEEAQSMAKRQIATEFGPEATFEIKHAEKAYYDNNGKILQPVYAFEAIIKMNDKGQEIKPAPYLCVIPLLKNSPEPLNLTKVDPKAMENIKAIDRSKIDSSGRGNQRESD
jgi:hypothetical protein